MPLTKNQRLTVRFSPGEQQKLELVAYDLGLDPSAYVRWATMQATTYLLEQIKEKDHA
jgi:hypothetical protein